MRDHATVTASSISGQLTLAVVWSVANADARGNAFRPHRLSVECMGKANQVPGDVLARNALRQPPRFGRLPPVAQGPVEEKDSRMGHIVTIRYVHANPRTAKKCGDTTGVASDSLN